MKFFKIIFSMMLLTVTTSVFAMQCPDTIYAEYGHYEPCAGWRVTANKLKINDPLVVRNEHYPLHFFMAFYNEPDFSKSVSCFYASRDGTNSTIKLTTVENDIPEPSKAGTHWKIDSGRGTCDMLQENASPSNCPWELKK